MIEIHTDVMDNGLSELTASGLKFAVCQTEPFTLLDCTGVSGSGGNRITSPYTLTTEVTLTDGANAKSRKVVVPDLQLVDSVLVAVTEVSADFWVVIYDDTRLLLKTDQITGKEVQIGASLLVSSISFGFDQ